VVLYGYIIKLNLCYSGMAQQGILWKGILTHHFNHLFTFSRLTRMHYFQMIIGNPQFMLSLL